MAKFLFTHYQNIHIRTSLIPEHLGLILNRKKSHFKWPKFTFLLYMNRESAAFTHTFNDYKYERERISSWKQTKLMNFWNISKTFSASLVEEKLRKFRKEGGYLTRKSNVKPGFFILSFIEKGKPVHKVAPNKVGKSFKQSFKDASVVLDEMA